MPSIKSAGIDILHAWLSPFITVNNEKRVRFYKEQMRYYTYKKILEKLADNQINLLYFAYGDWPQYYNLEKILYITNFKEFKVFHPRMEMEFTYGAVNNITVKDAIHYVKNDKYKFRTPLNSYLYTDKTFIRLSPFYIDVISEDTSVIEWIKREFEQEYAHDFDIEEVITEEEWYGE